MRGHENIIKIRQQGAKPAGSVFLLDFPIGREYTEWTSPEDAGRPVVCIDGDPINSLDFRFLIGLSVILVGDDATRVKALAAAVRKAGAESIIANAGTKFAVWKKGDETWLTF